MDNYIDYGALLIFNTELVDTFLYTILYHQTKEVDDGKQGLRMWLLFSILGVFTVTKFFCLLSNKR